MKKEEESKVESSVEDEKAADTSKEEQPQKSEEEGTLKEEETETEEEKDEFEKKEEFVSTNKYNQAVRKQREMELEKRDLEKKLEESRKEGVAPAPLEKKEEVEEKEDSFFDDVEDEELEAKPEKKEKAPDPSAIIDEKLRPVLERIDRKEKEDRRKSRTAFFEAHPEYLHDAEKWNGLLDELNQSINPNSEDDYFEQLNKAHILFTGQNMEDVGIATKKREIAGEAASGGDEARKATAEEEFNTEDRRYMKEWNISEDGMRAYKKKLAEGSMRIL
jgi:hypothetical protein